MDADDRLECEAGGHRIQRVPKNERNGRVHTSTVTVAVVRLGEGASRTFDESDCRVEFFSGTGAGGQHRNKKQNSARVTHVPTGEVAVAQSRSREANVRDAIAELKKRVDTSNFSRYNLTVNARRREQVGSGMRGDKVRTYRFRDDSVEDHRTGMKCRCSDFMNGDVHRLWKECK